jgi:putative membrane protein
VREAPWHGGGRDANARHTIATIAYVNGEDHPHVEWLADPAVLAPIGLLVVLYVRRFRAVRREGGGPGSGPVRGAGFLQAAAFTGAILALLAALITPLDGLGEDYLFSAHMLQHVLLGDIAPLLLLLSLSRVIMRPLTRRLAAVERALGPLAHPATGLVVWLVVMYAWHVPALYDAAAESAPLHALEHATFFVAGVAVWWPLIQPVPMRRRLEGMWPLAYIGVAKFGLAALGLYLTWSPDALYPHYEQAPRIWGLSAVEDQNVGGAIMMVEQSLTFVLVLVAVFVGMLTRSEADERRRERLEEAAGVPP